MSMGVWNESAQSDDIAQIRQALDRSREERANRAIESLRDKAPELLEIAAEAHKAGKVPRNGGVRHKGRKVVRSGGNYPYRDEAAQRNFQVVFWDNEVKHLEYSESRANPFPQEIRPVRSVEETGERMFDPEALTIFKETIREKTDITDEAYIMQLADLYFQ